MKIEVWHHDELIATIDGATLQEDLEELYSLIEYCPDTFGEWIGTLWLRLVPPDFAVPGSCVYVNTPELIEDASESPTWEEYLQELFPLPSDRRLTEGRITLNIPESWNVGCAEVTEIFNERDEWVRDEYKDSNLVVDFGIGTCDRNSVHSPDFWIGKSAQIEQEFGPDVPVVDFVQQCSIAWSDPFNR